VCFAGGGFLERDGNPERSTDRWKRAYFDFFDSECIGECCGVVCFECIAISAFATVPACDHARQGIVSDCPGRHPG